LKEKDVEDQLKATVLTVFCKKDLQHLMHPHNHHIVAPALFL